MKAAGKNRWGHRDASAILIAYRHGLRASELVALHVRRAKGGATSVHPIGAKESRALRRLQRESASGTSRSRWTASLYKAHRKGSNTCDGGVEHG
jgi:site-specific recombinase XerC